MSTASSWIYFRIFILSSNDQYQQMLLYKLKYYTSGSLGDRFSHERHHIFLKQCWYDEDLSDASILVSGEKNTFCLRILYWSSNTWYTYFINKNDSHFRQEEITYQYWFSRKKNDTHESIYRLLHVAYTHEHHRLTPGTYALEKDDFSVSARRYTYRTENLRVIRRGE